MGSDSQEKEKRKVKVQRIKEKGKSQSFTKTQRSQRLEELDTDPPDRRRASTHRR
jgi:hypothetical protein